MATQIYTFHIRYVGCENKIWRTLEISSNSDLATLGYAVLASFNTKAYHLFMIICKGIRYETDIENYDEYPLMREQKLSSLDFKPGEHINMIYDFGCEQEFDIEFVKERPMPRGTGRAYPKIINGAGYGIIDDMPAFELLDIIKKIDSSGKSDYVITTEIGTEMVWDYRKYDLKADNALLRGDVGAIREAYEECDYYDE